MFDKHRQPWQCSILKFFFRYFNPTSKFGEKKFRVKNTLQYKSMKLKILYHRVRTGKF